MKYVRLPLHTENISNLSICQISDFLRSIDEVLVFLSCYKAYVGRCLLAFCAKLIGHTFNSPLKLEIIGCPETSANYQYTLRHIPRQRRPHHVLSYKDYSTYSAAVQRKEIETCHTRQFLSSNNSDDPCVKIAIYMHKQQ